MSSLAHRALHSFPTRRSSDLPFRGAHKRLDALVDGHELGMKRLLSRLDEPKKAVDLFAALFARAIEKDSLSMATGETIADRKSTRLNSSHVEISYAVFCLKKK